jgi:hypothetical protein
MVVFSTMTGIAVAASMASFVQGHMIMKSPIPYGKSSLNNSPLAGDGSDFPCKQRSGVYDAEGASNVAAIGEPQTLSFIGGATHGGGSCQVSLTTDLQPTKNSKWMVIKSIEGGCPSDAEGNLSGNPSDTGASTFQYTIPEGIAPGDYTIAWTWFNHIGNREMYMNCGPMTVTGAKKKRRAENKRAKRQTSFPDIYKANIGNGCVTPDQVDLVFPNPGADVQTAGKGPYATPACDGGAGGNNAAQQPTGSAQQPAASAPYSGAPAATASATASAGGFANGGNNGQYTGMGAASTASNVPVGPSSPMTAPPYANTSASQNAQGAVAPTAGTASFPTPTTLSGGSAGSLSGPCPGQEGEWNCLGGTSFQRCASGSWSAAIPLGPGMKCQTGESSNFVMVAS